MFSQANNQLGKTRVATLTESDGQIFKTEMTEIEDIVKSQKF